MMLAIRLKPELEQRLERHAKATGRTKAFYAREAIEEHLKTWRTITWLSKWYRTQDVSTPPRKPRVNSDCEITDKALKQLRKLWH